MRPAVGFYWTLPVPWAGFTKLPAGIDEAAATSRTIAYQRELIRRFANNNGYRVIAEKVFLEVEPDRGSELILEALDRIADEYRAQKSTLLLVDFSQLQGSRAHWAIANWTEQHGMQFEMIYPEPVALNGRTFDPHLHFRDWKLRQQRWTAAKAERQVRALDRIAHLRSQERTNAQIASALNEKGIATPTGKRWSDDSVRKFWTAATKDRHAPGANPSDR
jgi:hypothetical protein